MASDDWTVAFPPGAICRSVMWSGKEVAHVNPAGDFTDETEAGLAAGIAHSAKMHRLIRRLADDATAPEGLRKDALALLTSVERMNTGQYEETPNG